MNQAGSTFHFVVTNPFIEACPRLRFTASFFDDPSFEKTPLDVHLQYSNRSTSHLTDIENIYAWHPSSLTLRGTGQWIEHTWHIPEAGLRSLIEGGADFRLIMHGPPNSDPSAVRVCVDRLEVGPLSGSLKTLLDHVNELFAEELVSSRVEARLEADTSLTKAERARAIELARSRGDPCPSILFRWSRRMVRSPGDSEEAYDRALRMAELARAEWTEWPILVNTIGVAQYRLGRPRDALDTLRQSDALNRNYEAPYPRGLDLAFIAICQHELGEADAARATLSEAISASPEKSGDVVELGRFLTEARARLGKSVYMNLGPSVFGIGLSSPTGIEDGRIEPGVAGSAADRRGAWFTRNYNMYFRIESESVRTSPRLRIRALIYDDPAFEIGSVPITLEYTNRASYGPGDIPNTFADHPDLPRLDGSGKWVEHVWELSDAGFRGIMQNLADFRFGFEGARVAVDLVEVETLGTPESRDKK